MHWGVLSKNNRKSDFGSLEDTKENQGLSEDNLEREIKPIYLCRERGETMLTVSLK